MLCFAFTHWKRANEYYYVVSIYWDIDRILYTANAWNQMRLYIEKNSSHHILFFNWLQQRKKLCSLPQDKQTHAIYSSLRFSFLHFFLSSLSSIWTSAKESFMKIRSGQKTLTELNRWIIQSSTVHRSVVYDILKTLLSGTKGTHLKTYSIQCLYDRVPIFHTCCMM